MKPKVGDTLKVISRHYDYTWLGNIKKTRYRVHELKVKAIFDNILLITVDDIEPQFMLPKTWNKMREIPIAWDTNVKGGEFE